MSNSVSIAVGAVFGAIIGAGLIAVVSMQPATTQLMAPVAVRPVTSVTSMNAPVRTYRTAATQRTPLGPVTAIPSSRTYEAAGVEFAHVESSGITNTHLGWAMISLGGIMGAISFYLSRKEDTVAMASTTSRREALMGVGVTAATGLLTPLPASALFGIGEDPKKEYNDMTLKLVGEIKAVLVLEKDDPKKPEAVVALRKEMNSWVARYRRDTRFSGKASYGNLYSVINAISGHYTNFGPKTPIPKKRAAQIVTEIAAVETLVPKGR